MYGSQYQQHQQQQQQQHYQQQNLNMNQQPSQQQQQQMYGNSYSNYNTPLNKSTFQTTSNIGVMGMGMGMGGIQNSMGNTMNSGSPTTSPLKQQSPYQQSQQQQQQKSQKYFTKQQISDYIDITFDKKISEWKNWTFASVFIVFLPLILSQMIFLTYMFSSSATTTTTTTTKNSMIYSIISNFGEHIIGITLYIIGQFILGISYHSICSVYRQVPASFREQFTILSLPHYIFIALNIIIQPLFLYFFFTLPINNFSLSSTVEVCYQDLSETYPIVKCQLEYNLFFYLFIISCFSLFGLILFRMYSNQEFVYSFSKTNLSTFLQIKSMLYNNFWISFYSSFYLFFLGSFLLGILFLFFFQTFTIQIFIYSIKLWCFTFVILFQTLTRNRLFEIYFTRGFKFTLDKFNSVALDSSSSSSSSSDTPDNGLLLSSANNNEIPVIENSNIYLLKAIFCQDDPLIQTLGWKDFLYLSKYSQTRRNYLYKEMSELLDDPSILKLMNQYENQINDLYSKLSCPREYYENYENYKKNDGQQSNTNTTTGTTTNQKSNFINLIINNFEKFLKKLINIITGIKFDYNIYECEIRQALSNTESILYSIEAIGSFIVSAQINDDKDTMELLHRYQIPQRFLSPLFRILALIDQLDLDLSHKIELDKFTITKDFYLLKAFSNSIEPPNNCIGILKTSRPHFRIFKLVGKNIISQVLETIGNQLSEISFPYELRSTLNSYKNGEFNIYQY